MASYRLFYRLFALVGILPLVWSIGERELLSKIKRAFDDVSAGTDAAQALERVFNTRFKQLLYAKHQQSIEGRDGNCEESLLSKYVDVQLAKLSPAAREVYWLLWSEGVDSWPFIVPLYSRKYTSFFPGKQQEQEYKKWMNVSQKFWNVSLKNVSLLPITGRVFTDDELLLPAVQWWYTVNATKAHELIDVAQEAMAKYPLLGPNFPLWSMNAMASRSDRFWPTTFVNIPAVTIGDGLSMFLASHRLREAGSDFIASHEIGHLVQFNLNISEFYNKSGPDKSRYIELLADAFAGYFAHHPRGASFQTNRILQASQAAFSIGDCHIDEAGHHGTPSQRARAVMFAAQLIDTSKVKGRILKPAEFKARFDAAYPKILARDEM